MSQFEDLNDNIDELSEVILKLNEKSGPPIDLTKYMLTKRQAAKKIMELASPESDKKDIHYVVYGKYEVDSNGKVVDDEDKYPWCVEHKRAIKITHPIFKEVKKMFREIKTSIRALGVKMDELQEAFKFAGKQLVNASVVAADAAAPPAPKIKTGIAAVQAVVAVIQDLAHKIIEILPFLGPLIDIPLIIMETALDMVLSVVNGILAALIVIIGSIATLKKSILPIIAGLKAIGGA